MRYLIRMLSYGVLMALWVTVIIYLTHSMLLASGGVNIFRWQWVIVGFGRFLSSDVRGFLGVFAWMLWNIGGLMGVMFGIKVFKNL